MSPYTVNFFKKSLKNRPVLLEISEIQFVKKKKIHISNFLNFNISNVFRFVCDKRNMHFKLFFIDETDFV